LIAGFLGLYVVWRAWREGFGKGEGFVWSNFTHAALRGVWALARRFIILGGIYGGVFSPTEAAPWPASMPSS